MVKGGGPRDPRPQMVVPLLEEKSKGRVGLGKRGRALGDPHERQEPIMIEQVVHNGIYGGGELDTKVEFSGG